MLTFFLFLNKDSQSTRKTTFRCMKPRIHTHKIQHIQKGLKNDFDDSKVCIETEDVCI